MFYLFQLARLSMSWLPGTASLYSFSPPRCICDLPVCDSVPLGAGSPHRGLGKISGNVSSTCKRHFVSGPQVLQRLHEEVPHEVGGLGSRVPRWAVCSRLRAIVLAWDFVMCVSATANAFCLLLCLWECIPCFRIVEAVATKGLNPKTLTR